MIESQTKTLDWLNKRLHQTHPARQINSQFQRIDELDLRLQRSLSARLEKLNAQLQNQSALLMHLSPTDQIERDQAQLSRLKQRLDQTIIGRLQESRTRFENTSQALHAISPLATLSRGYAIVTDPADKRIIRSADQLAVGQQISARLGKGSLSCIVEEINEA